MIPSPRLSLKRSDGGEPKVLGEGGDEPVIAPSGDRVLFERGRQIWSVSIDGLRPAAQLLFVRGNNSVPQFSPDGSRNRADRLSAPETR